MRPSRTQARPLLYKAMKRKELNNLIEHDRYVFHRYADDFERRHPRMVEGIRWALATAIMLLAIIGAYHLAGVAVGVW